MMYYWVLRRLVYTDVKWNYQFRRVENKKDYVRDKVRFLRRHMSEVNNQEETKRKEGYPNFNRTFSAVFRSEVFTVVADVMDNKM